MKNIAVVIPCFRVRAHILGVLGAIPEFVRHIYVVDDCCPEHTGKFVEEHCLDQRLSIIRCNRNGGVGGATKIGYRQALADGCDVIVKIDGDGQMDPRLIPELIAPLLTDSCDYAKGNRFYDLEHLKSMPAIRLVGNSCLGLFTKFSSGYWRLLDPTNGFTAITEELLRQLPLDKIASNFFFESDMLFRLKLCGAVIEEIPMRATYGDERSNLRVCSVIGYFLKGHAKNFGKRLFYQYFLRGFSIASIELVFGFVLFNFGIFAGICAWIESANRGVTASAGTVMLSALPLILGFQLLLSFLHYDTRDESIVSDWKRRNKN